MGAGASPGRRGPRASFSLRLWVSIPSSLLGSVLPQSPFLHVGKGQDPDHIPSGRRCPPAMARAPSGACGLCVLRAHLATGSRQGRWAGTPGGRCLGRSPLQSGLPTSAPVTVRPRSGPSALSPPRPAVIPHPGRVPRETWDTAGASLAGLATLSRLVSWATRWDNQGPMWSRDLSWGSHQCRLLSPGVTGQHRCPGRSPRE